MLHEKLAADFHTHLITGSLAEGEQDMSYLLTSERGLLRVPQMSREVSLHLDALAFWKVWRFLRKERPDIVHTHTAKAGALGRLAAKLAGVRVVVHTYHGHVFHGYFSPTNTRIILAVERLLGKLSDQVIAVSESQREELCAKYRVVSPSKVRVIHYGFELENFSRARRSQARQDLGIGPEEVVAAWVGRMVPVKDVKLLGQLIQRARENKTNVSFLVVGDGTERPVLESMIKGYGNVRLLGWRQDMERIWSAADFALLTSRNEGTPITLIEAMATGLPFVATQVGGVPDLAVTPWQVLANEMGNQATNGFLTARTPDALLYAIEQIAKNPQMAQVMGSVGKAFVLEKFSVSRLVAEMNNLYQLLLASRQPNAVAGKPSKEAASSTLL